MKRNYWLITDTHFNHKKMFEYCDRPQDYEARIRESLLAIPENDILIHLGDICIGQDMAIHDKYIKPLQCKTILVKGNHDGKSDNWYLNNGWDFVVRRMIIKESGKHILFSHMPQTKEVGKYKPDMNIHGHFHNSTHRHTDFKEMYDDHYHKLLAIEFTDYQAVKLDSFILSTT